MRTDCQAVLCAELCQKKQTMIDWWFSMTPDEQICKHVNACTILKTVQLSLKCVLNWIQECWKMKKLIA